LHEHLESHPEDKLWRCLRDSRANDWILKDDIPLRPWENSPVPQGRTTDL
jgi:hypothetical protein